MTRVPQTVTRVCEGCGRTFEAPTRLSSGQCIAPSKIRKTCSDACRETVLSRATRAHFARDPAPRVVTRTCEGCGRTFETPAYSPSGRRLGAHAIRKTCSPECQRAVVSRALVAYWKALRTPDPAAEYVSMLERAALRPPPLPPLPPLPKERPSGTKGRCAQCVGRYIVTRMPDGTCVMHRNESWPVRR